MTHALLSGRVAIVSGVSFTDASTGTAVGDSGTILRTTGDWGREMALESEFASPFISELTVQQA
jgi:photosystem II stability/assembly factor-like uncharacterized protein